MTPAPTSSSRTERQPVRLVATSFDAMEGFDRDDHLEAHGVFLRTARAIAGGEPSLRPALEPSPDFRRLCGAAVRDGPPQSRGEARRRFETRFRPHRLECPSEPEETGFLTGYYEPEVDGSLEKSADFAAPILRRPSGLGRSAPGTADDPYADRASLEAQAEQGLLPAVVWLRDWVEVFFIHVQGSARVRLADGRLVRLVYDGRNGHAYTSIGRVLVERGDIPAEDMSLGRLKRWLREHGQGVGEPGRDLIRANRSYIFFRGEWDPPGEGPIGGAGVPLSPLRSIAVDRGLWSYGLPFWVEADLPGAGRSCAPFRRLVMAQDTGSAILGAARADLFIGSGEEAGRPAGDIRHAARFVVLLPRPCRGEP